MDVQVSIQHVSALLQILMGMYVLFCCFVWYLCVCKHNCNRTVTSFDNFFHSMLQVFVIISLEGWTSLMYRITSCGSEHSWIFFFSLTFIVGFFAANLCLAVIEDVYSEQMEKQQKQSEIDGEDKYKAQAIIETKYAWMEEFSKQNINENDGSLKVASIDTAYDYFTNTRVLPTTIDVESPKNCETNSDLLMQLPLEAQNSANHKNIDWKEEKEETDGISGLNMIKHLQLKKIHSDKVGSKRRSRSHSRQLSTPTTPGRGTKTFMHAWRSGKLEQSHSELDLPQINVRVLSHSPFTPADSKPKHRKSRSIALHSILRDETPTKTPSNIPAGFNQEIEFPNNSSMVFDNNENKKDRKLHKQRFEHEVLARKAILLADEDPKWMAWIEDKPWIIQQINKIVIADWFSVLVMVIIITNTVVLALEWPNQNEDLRNILEIANLTFTFFFIFEMMIKLIGVGPKAYFADRWNIFDFIIVSISIIELVCILLLSIVILFCL